MYPSQILNSPAESMPAPFSGVRHLIEQAGDWLMSALSNGAGERVQRVGLMRDVLRLDALTSTGQTPGAYGLRVDDGLHVDLDRQPEPAQPVSHDDSPERSTADANPPERGVEERVYRVPRTRRTAPRLSPLGGQA